MKRPLPTAWLLLAFFPALSAPGGPTRASQQPPGRQGRIGPDRRGTPRLPGIASLRQGRRRERFGTLPAERLRVMIETDAGGDPDDEQSLVRFLLYTNEWDVEGIIANRPVARERENRNPERTGLAIVRRLVAAYGQCYPNLARHDPRYPRPEDLLKRCVAGYEDTRDGVNLLVAAVDRADPRPIWFCNWGTDGGAGPSNLKRALDQVLRERGPTGYERFKNRLRLSSADRFGEHTSTLAPPWKLWVDTFRPELEGRRWYHRFSPLTATAGGFDLQRDVLIGHGPLGALYPTNTTLPQKEGDTMSFLYLLPTGMNDPEHPDWGSWAGRYGLNPDFPGRAYYWANQEDTWEGTTSRDNTLRRWAVDLQNDFRARLEWCVCDFAHANHPPVPHVQGAQGAPWARSVRSGERVTLDATRSTDPDGQRPEGGPQAGTLRFAWTFYPEAGTYRGALPLIQGAGTARASFTAPEVVAPAALHVLLTVTDSGTPPLSRYQRVIVEVAPQGR